MQVSKALHSGKSRESHVLFTMKLTAWFMHTAVACNKRATSPFLGNIGLLGTLKMQCLDNSKKCVILGLLTDVLQQIWWLIYEKEEHIWWLSPHEDTETLKQCIVSSWLTHTERSKRPHGGAITKINKWKAWLFTAEETTSHLEWSCLLLAPLLASEQQHRCS